MLRHLERRLFTTCTLITSAMDRGVLRDADGDAGGGGGDRAFSQADVDRIVGDRLGKLKSELAETRKALSELDQLKSALSERDQELGRIREETELKGKSEIEKLQHQIAKLGEGSKKAEAEWAAKVKAAEAQAGEWQSKHTSYVKRSPVSSALLAADVVPTAVDDALVSFLGSAEIELDESGKAQRVLVGGKSFESPIEAAKHFLSEKPHFAKPPEGGSGGPRRTNGAGSQAPLAGSIASLISAGMAQRK